MLNLLFFIPEQDPQPALDDIAHALVAEPGLELSGVDGDAYRSGRWVDPATKARAVIDCGVPPVEEDSMHPPKHYEGWRQVPLCIQLPLAGPHWCAVEALAMVERLLARLPGLQVIDTEEEREPEEDFPGPLDRMRVLASWERVMVSQLHGRDEVPQMPRLASIAVWRYRRERQAAERACDDQEVVWPEALALVEGTRAYSCALWMDPALPLALPPVELVVIRRGPEDVGVLPADELLTAAGNPASDGACGAQLIPVTDATRSLFAHAVLQPIGRYRFTDIYDFVD